VSPDGRNLYVAGYQGDALHVFDRDPITGRLTKPRGKASCFSESLEVCTHVRGFDEPLEFAISPDGADLYALAGDSDSLAIFDRDPNTGALHQRHGTAGCISATGAGGCQADPLIEEPAVITISPDGKSVYVVSARTEALLVFSRDPVTGDLTQVQGVAGCLSTVQGGVTAACGHAPLGRTLERLQVTPDGQYVYLDENLVALGGKPAGVVLRLKRDPASGQLTFEPGPAGCISSAPMAEGCRLYEAVETPVGMALSRDGSSLYVTSAGAVLTLDRDQATGALSPLAGDTGCIQWSRSFRKLAECRPARGMVSPIGVAVSPDGDEVFVAAYGGEARDR